MAGPLVTTSDRQRDLERVEIDLLLDGLARHHGYDFRRYAKASITRRVRHALRSEGLATISELQHRVLHDADALDRFVRTVTIHVTSMFRDPDVYQAFRQKVVPALRTYPFIRIWIAGCSTGEEAYSLAILLDEVGLHDRCRIYATDISDTVLERARRGIFPLDAMRRYTEAYHRAGGRLDFSRYYVADAENAILSAHLRKHILFSNHNLACDGSFNEFNVIFCRNVLIYFENDLRDRVLRLLQDSLGRFGYLALGKKETLDHTPVRERFEVVSPESRIYRRIA